MNQRAMSSSQVRSGILFTIGSIGAGLLNYLFHVVAARYLDAAAFAKFSGWFANTAMLFVFGGIAQYFANFWPVSKSLRAVIISANLITFLLLFIWKFISSGLTIESSVLIVLAATIFGWLSGQSQIRWLYGCLAGAGLLVAFTKILLLVLPVTNAASLDTYAWVLLVSYIPGLWLLSAFLWNSSPVPKSENPPSLIAPIFLAIAAAVLPHFDLAILSHTLDSTDFSEFARASVFFKAVFYLVSILAQWILPYQIRGRSFNISTWLPVLILGGFASSAVLAFTAPFVTSIILHWPTTPDFSLLLLSGMHVSILSIFLMTVQEACARGQIRVAALMFVILLAEAATQFLLNLKSLNYLYAVITVNGALIIFIWIRQLKLNSKLKP